MVAVWLVMVVATGLYNLVFAWLVIVLLIVVGFGDLFVLFCLVIGIVCLSSSLVLVACCDCLAARWVSFVNLFGWV